MKYLLILVLCLFIANSINAQVPQAFSYKVQIRGNSGNPHANKKINLKISILQESADGSAVYIEKHQVNTSRSGIVDIEIGRGAPIQGLFTEIDWKNWPYFVKAELDLKCTGNYNILAITELLTVPYAMMAGNLANNNDADADPENEIQVLSISNDTIFLSKGGFIVLPSANNGNYFYSDRDGDGFGDKFEPLWLPETVLPPYGFVTDMNDCNDNDAATHPNAIEMQGDGIDQDCDGTDLSGPDSDDDGDNFTENQGDCNDSDPLVHPGAIEILDDGVDQDCDGTDSSGAYTDDDGDGFTEKQGDCNDNNAAIYPGAPEIFNDGFDNDCDGAVDVGYTTSFDWRNYSGQNFMSPVKSTGNCGVCYAFAPVAALETMIRYQTNSPEANIDLSEQHAISCTSGNDGCNGGSPSNILGFMRYNGIVEESSFPYASANGSIPSCEIFPTETKKYKISGYQKLPYNNPLDIKRALGRGPVIVMVKVYSELYTYNSGLYYPQTTQYLGLVTNLIVGYGYFSFNGQEYWIVRNNWGESWGENGYYKLAFSSTLSLIENDAVYVIDGFQ